MAAEKEAPGKTYAWEIGADAVPHTSVALCMDADGQPTVSVYGADWFQAYQGEVYVFERLAPMPRAYVVYAAEHIPDDTQAVGRLLDESFDLRNVAVVADSLDLPSATDMPAGRADIVDYRETSITIHASARQPGLLVLGDQFHPGWKVSLDGQPSLVVRANHVMRGVVVPPGDHQVVFEFAPESLRLGGYLCLAGAVMVVALTVLDSCSCVKRWLRSDSLAKTH